MALGIDYESGGGDIMPIIKFDAKTGDLMRVDKHKDEAGVWQKTQIELATPISMIMYMAEIEVGWACFAGGRPDFRMVKLGQPMPDKPEAEGVEYKQAFRVRIQNKELGLREFSSQAKLVLKAFDALHNEYEAQKDANAGKVPVVTISDIKTEVVTTQQGDLRFKVPAWSITQWVDKPDAATPAASAQEVSQPVAPIETGADLF
ncbi:MAG: hypothetical protein ACPGQQ_03545 [Candidatus Puniceispirillaceae bacterium]